MLRRTQQTLQTDRQSVVFICLQRRRRPDGEVNWWNPCSAIGNSNIVLCKPRARKDRRPPCMSAETINSATHDIEPRGLVYNMIRTKNRRYSFADLRD